MSKQWAEDEAKLGFSGPPAEIGWADHEEIVAQLNARQAFFRQQAEEWREEAVKLRQVLNKVENRLEQGHTAEQVLDYLEGIRAEGKQP